MIEQIRCVPGLTSIRVFERMTEDETFHIRVGMTVHCGCPAHQPGPIEKVR